MGPRQVELGTLFYEFSIEDYVPKNYLEWTIDLLLIGPMRGLCWRRITAMVVGLRLILN